MKKKKKKKNGLNVNPFTQLKYIIYLYELIFLTVNSKGEVTVKWIVYLKMKSLSLFPLRLFQSWIYFFVLLNTNVDIWQNVYDLTEIAAHLHYFVFIFQMMKYPIIDYSNVFGYRHSSKYLPLCSAEQRNLYSIITT